MQSVVMYHTRCFDGTMAAAAALKAIQEGTLDCNPETGLIPINYNQSDLETFFQEDGPFEKAQKQGANDFTFVDFCPKAAVVRELLARECTVVILDHHKTAMADVKELEGLEGLTLNFDMTKSGAAMAWEYWHGEIPDLVLHVEDRDLWKWKMKNTREIMAWLSSFAETNDPQTYLDAIQEFNYEDYRCVQTGSALCKEMDTQIQRMASAYRYVEFPPFGKGIVVNATCYPSEVCQYLYDEHEVPFVIAYSATRGGDFALSFRSKQGAAHSIDVTTLAKEFEGGGHANASGGICDLESWAHLLGTSTHQGSV